MPRDLETTSLWAITAYFNPAGDRSRRRRFRIFRRELGVPLVAVELVYGAEPELHPSDAEILVRLPGHDVLWQRERLLTLALERLPAGVEHVAWIDADVVFERRDWAELAVARLASVPAVQLFEELVEVRPSAAAVGSSPLAAAEVLDAGPSLARRLRDQTSDVLANAYALNRRRAPGERVGSGIGWAFRRQALEGIGFYNGSVVGGNDRAMACAMLGRFDLAIRNWRMSTRRAEHFQSWACEFHDRIRGAIDFLPQRVFHLWHGEVRHRGYGLRHRALQRHRFDPYSDVTIDDWGCLRWSSRKPALHRFVRDWMVNCPSADQAVSGTASDGSAEAASRRCATKSARSK